MHLKYIKKTSIGILKRAMGLQLKSQKRREKHTKERSYKVSRREEEIEESRAKPFTSNATFLLLHQLIKPIKPSEQVGCTSRYLVAIMPERDTIHIRQDVDGALKCG